MYMCGVAKVKGHAHTCTCNFMYNTVYIKIFVVKIFRMLKFIESNFRGANYISTKTEYENQNVCSWIPHLLEGMGSSC